MKIILINNLIETNLFFLGRLILCNLIMFCIFLGFKKSYINNKYILFILKVTLCFLSLLFFSFFCKINVNFKLLKNLVKENSFEVLRYDVKQGNNNSNAFTNIISEINIFPNEKPYTIVKQPLNFENLQASRYKFLQDFELDNESKEKQIYLDNALRNILEINNNLLLNNVDKNILIQANLFNLVCFGIYKKFSFYAANIYNESFLNDDLYEKFYLRLEPYINDHIFDNKETFNKFFSKCLKIYDEEVESIISKAEKSTYLQNYGFNEILKNVYVEQ